MTGATIIGEWGAGPGRDPEAFIRLFADGTWEAGTAGRPGETLTPRAAWHWFRDHWGRACTPPDAAGHLADRLVWWSVIDGPSPGARAVEPGAAGVGIPGDILAWAVGLSEADPDVYLLVTTMEDAAAQPVLHGEIGCRLGEMPAGAVTAIRAAVAEEAAERGGYLNDT
jgi:hypothetical protein